MPKREWLNIKTGVPEYLTRENEIQYFYAVVEKMKEAYPDWDTPPLIAESGKQILSGDIVQPFSASVVF